MVCDSTRNYRDTAPLRKFVLSKRIGKKNPFSSLGVRNQAPKIKLNNGLEMPSLGLGTCMRNAASGDVTQSVKDAIDAGYRHIDAAFSYMNEREVGNGIKAKLADGTVKRDELFVVSKLWNTFHRPDLVEVALRRTLADLGLDYMDLYLVHFPTAFKEGNDCYPRDENGNMVFSNVNITDTWGAMEQLVRKGLVKSIGLSNFNSHQIDRILSSCTIPPATNQIEVHPYFNNEKLINFCKSRNILVTGYSPLRNPEKHNFNEPPLLHDPKLMEIARKYNKSVAQIILRWNYQRGIAVVCKSSNKDRIAENLNVYDFNLSLDDMHSIQGVNRNRRANTFFQKGGAHIEYPFSIEF